jgi:hypothetical protein
MQRRTGAVLLWPLFTMIQRLALESLPACRLMEIDEITGYPMAWARGPKGTGLSWDKPPEAGCR